MARVFPTGPRWQAPRDPAHGQVRCGKVVLPQHHPRGPQQPQKHLEPPVWRVGALIGQSVWSCAHPFYTPLPHSNKAVVFELLYLIYHEGKTEEEALAALDAQLVNGTLKTPTVAGLAYHLREKGAVSTPERKSTVDHILLSLIRYDGLSCTTMLPVPTDGDVPITWFPYRFTANSAPSHCLASVA